MASVRRYLVSSFFLHRLGFSYKTGSCSNCTGTSDGVRGRPFTVSTRHLTVRLYDSLVRSQFERSDGSKEYNADLCGKTNYINCIYVVSPCRKCI